MNVTCNKCNKRYAIADEKVRGKSVKIRCKQCQNLISVQGPLEASAVAPGAAGGLGEASPWEEERTRAMPALDVAANWFAMVKGQQIGPFNLASLKERVDGGEVSLRTYLWKQGMADWKRASEVPELSPVFAGVSVSTTPGEQSSSVKKPLPQRPARDVATGNETPVTAAKKAPQSTLAYGHPAATAQQFKIEAPAAEPKSQTPLGDLFSDIAPESALPDAAGAETATSADEKKEEDPFAALGDADPKQGPPPGEATKFFIAQAGVNKRNPPWKIALFVVSFICLPVGVLYLLSSLHIVPLQVQRTTESGEVIEESFFSPGGVSSLKDMLTGEEKRRRTAAEWVKKQKAAAAIAAVVPKKKEEPVDEKPVPVKPSDPSLALIYGDGSKTDKGPKNRHNDDNRAATDSAGGLDTKVTSDIVGRSLPAFQLCIEAALRRNPNLKAGSVNVNVTAGASGTVKSVEFEPKSHEGSDWAVCIKDRARRIVFPASDRETEVQIPLKVGASMGP